MPNLDDLLRAEFGVNYENLVNVLPSNPVVSPYLKRELSDITQIVCHHTEASRATTWQSVNRYHIDHNGWSRAGYHLAVRDYAGRCIVSMLNEPMAHSYHAHTVGNLHGLAVCVAGKFDSYKPTAAELDALRRIVAVVRRWAIWREWLPVVGHCDVLGNDTSCPGKYLKEVIPILNATVIDDAELRAAVWKAATEAQVINPNADSAIMKTMKEQGYFAIGREVDVRIGGVWQGTAQLAYQHGGDERGVAFFASNLTPDGQWGVDVMEAP